jgi:Tol biopolymer transport system component
VLVDSDAFNNAEQPTISPDGASVAFAWTRDSLANGLKSVFDIWVMDIEGRNQRRLTMSNPVESGNGAGFPAWSPDGRRLAYTSPAGGIVRLFTMNVDGTQQQQVAGTDGGFAPAWSPDGRRLVFFRNTAADGAVTIWTADLGTGSVAQVPVNPTETGGAVPSWSTDGQHLLYTRGGARVVLYDVKTRAESVLPIQGKPIGVVFCGHADQLLVRIATTPGQAQLVLVGTDGSRPTTIVDAAGPEGLLSCSPGSR